MAPPRKPLPPVTMIMLLRVEEKAKFASRSFEVTPGRAPCVWIATWTSQQEMAILGRMGCLPLWGLFFLVFEWVTDVAFAEGQAAWERPMAPATAESPCRNWSCLRKSLGVHESETRGTDGRILKRVVTSTTESEIQLGYAGELREVRTYQRQPRLLLEVQQFGGTSRTQESFRGGRKIRQRRWFQLPIPERPILFEIEEYSLDGRLVKRTHEWIHARGPALATRASCLGGIEPLTASSSEVGAILAQSFANLDSGTAEVTSPDSIRFQFERCEGRTAPSEIQRRLMLNALQEGLRCMMDPRRGGGGSPSRGQADAALLLAMLSRPSQPFTVRCGTVSELHGNLGEATICPSIAEPLGDHASTPPFPGISIATNVSMGDPIRQLDFKRTFFHEMLHTVGYPHGHFPEVTYTCERCCFPSAGASAEAACRLCSTGDDPSRLTPDYMIDFLRVNGGIPNQTPLLNMVNLILERGGSAELARYADRILQEFCPSHNFADETLCDPNMTKAYAILGGIRARIGSISPEEQGLLDRASANFDDDHRVFTNTSIILLSERFLGRTPARARSSALDFFRTYECPNLGTGESNRRLVAAGFEASFLAAETLFREDAAGNPSLIFPGLRSGGAEDLSLERVCSSRSTR
jgi:hypothetical protein